MKDFVPDDVRELIDALEAKQNEEYRRRKQVEDAELARQAKMEVLRGEREADLREACRTINAWLERFETSVGPAIWRLNHDSIVIFVAKFANDMPCAPEDAAHTAQLRFGAPGKKTSRLWYTELNGDDVITNRPQLGALHLWYNLHPDFVLQCAAHLSGPDAWAHIRAKLEKIAAAAS